MSMKIQIAGGVLCSDFNALRSGLLAPILITLAIQPCAVGQAEVNKSAQNYKKMTDITHTTVAPAALMPATQTIQTPRTMMNEKTIVNLKVQDK